MRGFGAREGHTIGIAASKRALWGTGRVRPVNRATRSLTAGTRDCRDDSPERRKVPGISGWRQTSEDPLVTISKKN